MAKSISDKAYAIYQKSGYTGVLDWAKGRNHKSWGHCRDCEMEVPMHKNECLVCGQPVSVLGRVVLLDDLAFEKWMKTNGYRGLVAVRLAQQRRNFLKNNKEEG